MTREQTLFLQALEASLEGQTPDWDRSVTEQELAAVLKLARDHRVLPMVYQAVHGCPVFSGLDAGMLAGYRRNVMQAVMLQTRRTAEFLPVLAELRSAGVHPLVVKGLVCRKLFPAPDQRLSSDEDVLIPPEEFEICHRVLTGLGFSADNPEDPHEVSYRGEGSLYLEIHKSLFPEDSLAYGDLNRFFRDCRQRAAEQDGIPTLSPTDHMLYLLLHAFKHFLHSGFGIRQVCDMVCYANAWGTAMDWEWILACCREARAERFAAGLFKIGAEYLGFYPEKSGYSKQWMEISVEIEPLLEDILCAGVYGSAQKSRLHSATVTVNAVADRKQGKRPLGAVRSLFPRREALQGRYPWLKDKPWLLPAAWADRIVKYGRETLSRPDSSAADSLRIGRERLELLEFYGILDKKK